MKNHQIRLGTSRRVTGAIAKTLVLALFVIAGSLIHIPKAEAARCSADGSNCSYKERTNWYWCGVVYTPRTVRYQVPEGTPPAGGWRTAFFYNGTTPTSMNPYVAHPLLFNAFGVDNMAKILKEMLDNPSGTGHKYATFAPNPPASAIVGQFWHTNSVFPYWASCDSSFFPEFFKQIKDGKYGSSSQYNLNQRYAFGISSGGYNSSRMAVTFNGSSVWKALGIISASYASCAGPLCSVPTLPSNHPPTKFWHGTNDLIVPMFTMEKYYDKLIASGKVAAKKIHDGGHELTPDNLGSTGVKNWFDAY